MTLKKGLREAQTFFLSHLNDYILFRCLVTGLDCLKSAVEGWVYIEIYFNKRLSYDNG